MFWGGAPAANATVLIECRPDLSGSTDNSAPKHDFEPRAQNSVQGGGCTADEPGGFEQRIGSATSTRA